MKSATAIEAMLLSARNEKINVRVPEQLKKQLQREADTRKMKLSDYVVTLLLERNKK